MAALSAREEASELFDRMQRQSSFRTGWDRYTYWWSRQSQKEVSVRLLVVAGACLTVLFSIVAVVCGDTLCHPRSNKGYASFTNWAAFAIGLTALAAALLEKVPLKDELDKAEPQGISPGGTV